MLKLKGQGDAGRSGGPPGDLYVTFVVKASAGMRRRGMDLYSEVLLSPQNAWDRELERSSACEIVPVGIVHACPVEGRIRFKGLS